MKRLDRILLVEDDDIANALHKLLLNRAGLASDIVITRDGREALNYLKECQASAAAYPDLIFLDIKMPLVNGFEFLEAFAKTRAGLSRRLPVVMLSSSLNEADVEKAYSLGADLFLDKPLNQDKLEEVWGKLFAA